MSEQESMEAVEKVVAKAARSVVRMVPALDLEEVLSESTTIALEAVRSYKSDRGMKLTTWVYECVWKRLISNLRSGSWQRRFSKAGIDVPEGMASKESFDINRLMMEVSGNARVAIRTALEKDQKKTALVRTLREEFAWEMDLIREVFQEIREAL